MRVFQDYSFWAKAYQGLSSSLQPYSAIWQHSLLQSPRSEYSPCQEAWLEALRALSFETLQRFDNEEPIFDLPLDLHDLMQQFAELALCVSQFPKLPLASVRATGLSRKKQHEIAAVVAFVQAELGQLAVQQITDIGGGLGHLARHLIAATCLPLHSIDSQARLQTEGRQTIGPLWPDAVERQLHYHSCQVKAEAQPELELCFSPASFSVGLHTCGPLAWYQLQKSRECVALLNLACCYDRLDPEREFGRSAFAASQGLKLSTPALFLATRGRKGKSRETFAFQYRAQSYRFALHVLLRDSGLAPEFISVGNTPKQIYRNSFASYALDRCQHLKIPLRWLPQQLEAFFASAKVQQEVQDIWLADLLRSRFSRPLELLILLDRALWLGEQGREVALIEFFDRELSPRNIGIYSMSKGGEF